MERIESPSNVDWVVNFQASLLSLVNLRHPIVTWEGQAPITYQFSEVEPFNRWSHFPTDEKLKARSLTHSILMQAEVTGVCDNVYDATRTSRREVLLATPQRLVCIDRPHTYQVFKTRNFDQCRSTLVYNVVAPAGWHCRAGAATCENVQSRSLISRFVLCGNAVRRLELLRVDLNEQVVTWPLGVKGSSQTVAIEQHLTLINKVPERGGDSRLKSNAVGRSLVWVRPPGMSADVEFCSPDRLIGQLRWLRRFMRNHSTIVDRSWSRQQQRTRTCLQQLNLRALYEAVDHAHAHLSDIEWYQQLEVKYEMQAVAANLA